MKLLTAVGARPHYIKAAIVSRVVRDRGDATGVLVHAGQHYDANMSDVFFDELDISRPNYHLGFGGDNHGAMTGRQLEAIEDVLLDEKPDWMLVYGDTNSTLAGVSTRSKLNTPLIHVEAGLPVHPRTRARLTEQGLDMPKHVHVVDPVGYLEMVWLEMNCAIVASDSGGVQEEGISEVLDAGTYSHFVHLHGHGKPYEALMAQAEADLPLMLESSLPEAKDVLTDKIFEYVAAGVPILLLLAADQRYAAHDEPRGKIAI